MKSKQKPKSNKLLDIMLSEEKFYFPGETIKGSVIVRPKKNNMKINQIHIKFVGYILIAAVEKEIVPLFTRDQCISAKSVLPEAGKPCPFAFEFIVPENCALPSAMELGGKKIAGVHYKLTAILDRPMMLESLCPKVEYPVHVLEHIDITTASRSAAAFKQKDYLNSHFTMKINVPRSGYTRGETIPVTLIVNTRSKFVKKGCVVIELIRKVRIRTNKNQKDEEHVLKSNTFDLNIIGPYNFSQSITSRILIPSTPPTIKYRDTLLRIQYKIRAKLTVNSVDNSKKYDNNRADTCTLELPIIIGTWPRADIPIDDDDDDDMVQTMGELTLSDLEDDEDFDEDESIGQESAVRNIIVGETKDSNGNGAIVRNDGDINMKRHSLIGMQRSESNGSTASWLVMSQQHQQQQLYQQYQSTSPTSTMYNNNNNSSSPVSLSSPSTLSTTTTTVTTPTATTALAGTAYITNKNIYENQHQSSSASYSQQIFMQSNRNNALPLTNMNSTVTDQFTGYNNAYISESASTPDFQQQLQQPRLSTAKVKDPTLHTSSFFENNITVTVQSHRRNPSIASSLTDNRQLTHQRNDSAGSTRVYSNTTPTIEPDVSVPNHTLTFISSASTSTTSRAPAFNNSSMLLDSDFEGDMENDDEDLTDDDDDLLAIIEKKKKREEREMRQRQRMFYTATN